MPNALVTGGGRGIGENIARALAEDGYHVTVTGRTREQVEGVAASIDGQALLGDVSKRDDVDRWASEVDELDVLICNAGMSGPRESLADPDEWWRTFEVNVLGLYLCCHAFAPRMVERGSGRIVNVASGAAYLPMSVGGGSTAYGASKAAVHRFSELLAGQLTPQGVFVFSISPGLVRTEKVMEAAQWLDLSNSESPEFIGRAVAALAADPDLLRHSGKVLVAASLAREYGFTDIDGKTPRPLTIADV